MFVHATVCVCVRMCTLDLCVVFCLVLLTFDCQLHSISRQIHFPLIRILEANWKQSERVFGKSNPSFSYTVNSLVYAALPDVFSEELQHELMHSDRQADGCPDHFTASEVTTTLTMFPIHISTMYDTNKDICQSGYSWTVNYDSHWRHTAD